MPNIYADENVVPRMTTRSSSKVSLIIISVCYFGFILTWTFLLYGIVECIADVGRQRSRWFETFPWRIETI